MPIGVHKSSRLPSPSRMFVMRLMHSGQDFAWLYTRQDQTSFLDGHVRAFAHFECVPQRIAYDNLISSCGQWKR